MAQEICSGSNLLSNPSNVDSQCPLDGYQALHLEQSQSTRNGSTTNAGIATRETTQENENGGTSSALVLVGSGAQKSIPYQWWRFGLHNMWQLKTKGHNFLSSGAEGNCSTVYKIKLNEWRTMVCDHLALKDLLDFNKVKRDLAFGNLSFQRKMLRSHIPCVLTYDEQHRKRKEFLLNFISAATQEITVKDTAEAIQLQFEKMYRIEFSNVADAELYDFEGNLRKAVANVIPYCLLGEYVEKSELIYQWQEKTIKALCQPFDCFSKKDDILTKKLFDMVKATRKMKELKANTVHIRGNLSFDEMLSEVVWTIGFEASGGIVSMVTSCLLCYLRLSESDKELLKHDANTFFSASNTSLGEVLPTLKHIHAFYMEVIRLHPPIAAFFGRAKTDFVLQSTSGNFQIKRNDLLCGYPYMAQRDPNLFEKPNYFRLNRPVEITERYNFTYGGYYLSEPIADNRKCPGHSMSNTIVKLFVLFFTKCSIVASKVPVYTGRNYKRLAASDNPLSVMYFHYER